MKNTQGKHSMNTKHTLTAAAAALLLGISTAASADCTSAANLIANCGFETGDFQGWTVAGKDTPVQEGNFYGVEQDDPLGIAANGGSSQAYVLDPVNTLTLSQTFATKVGADYTVSFYVDQNALDGDPLKSNSLKATFGTSSLLTMTNVADSAYTLYTYDVTATQASTTFSVAMIDETGQWLLDDFSVTRDVPAVPEAPTPLLMGAGLLALGFAARRKQQ
jgi:hypothetical protein